MRDASTGQSVPDGAEEAALAPSQDGDPSPQARDKRPIIIGRREHTDEPDRSDIEEWREAYKNNPLIRVPVQNFSADVLEPGVSVTLGSGDDSPPTVRDDYHNEAHQGLDLDDALERWFANCYVDGWDFDADATDLLELIVKDRRGRRGTGIVEHAWDDPEQRERLLALRPIKAETTTAYTREGKGIVLRPDDDANEFESVAIQDLGDSSREEAPTTPAGKTAALAQFDDVFGSSERDEIPFALDDITVSPYDADTGELFGRPDTASVVDRADAVKEKLEHVDQAVLNTAFANIIAKVDTDDRELAKKIRDDLSVNTPETVSGTNVPVELEQVDGTVPDAVDTIQQEIEFVLAAMPTPLYRVGFAGDINRDITTEQREDYRDEVKRERRRLEADFQTTLELKAREFLHDDAQADEQLDVEPELRIRPEEASSPLRDEEFDPEAFNTLMSGLSTAAGPKGGADTILPQREIIDTLLDMDADEILGDDGEADLEALDESDPRVQEAFAEFTQTAELATRYSEGDTVDTPGGLGVVTAVWTESWESSDETVEASDDSPAYMVALVDGGYDHYSASGLEATELPEIDDVEDPVDDVQATADLAAATEADLADATWSYPDSWEESKKPARLILLDAWASLGGQFDCGGACCMGEFNDAEFCAAMKDRALGTEQWRGWGPD